MELYKFNPGKRLIGAVIGILFLSVLAFSFLIINWPQESPYRSATIQIPKGSTVSDVSRILKEKKIITNERIFRMAVRALGYDKRLPAGSYSINGAKSNYQIIHQLVYGAPNLKRLTVLEGWKINDIAAEIEMVLGTDANAFLELCTKKSLLKKWNIAHDSFEGFLLPDTYYFMENEKPENILKKMVQEYHRFISDELRDRARKLGLKELEVITLASIIEGEALFDEERPIISGVYHNRLQKRMKLQADPTIQYIIKDGPRRLLNNDLKIKSPYNTYLNKGLPPGPINNPGKESIMAALYPNENEYLYFVARGDGFHKFSKTEKEHLIAKKKFQKIRREVRRKAKTNKANS
ncbi:MAG: endolytic transglycosylase MltG [Fidelibacterota bacterium]